MEKKVGQHPGILENIRQNIAVAEEKRRELRFIYTLNEFEQGNVRILHNDEFITGLEHLLLADHNENREKKIQLLGSLGQGALAEEPAVRERALAVLSSATQFHLAQNDHAVLSILAHCLCRWLEFETAMLPGFTVVHKRIEDILNWFLNTSCWAEAEVVVRLLRRIQAGDLKKNKAIQSVTNRTLRNLEKKSIVEKLTGEYLRENEQQLVLRKILQAIGHKAVLYLLNRVIHSPSRTERLALLELIPTFGERAVPVLEDCLEKNPPWAVVRNIVYMISVIGIDAHYALVERYLGHPDERVQLEIIKCVLKLGGKMMISRLTQGLEVVHDRLKIHILRLLVERADNDEKILTVLLRLAAKSTAFSPQAGHDLLLAVIASLKTFPDRKSVEQLKKMGDAYRSLPGAEQPRFYIDDALKVIEPKLRHQLRHIDASRDTVSFDHDPVQQRQAFEKLGKAEEEVQALVRAGKTEQAGQLLYEQGLAAAKLKDFSVAELLRDRILGINPMAFSEVIQLGEFIEEQKNTSIASHHLAIWNELYEEMTTEEFNQLYDSLHRENYRQGDIIVQSGETDNSLYFLNSGYISLSCIVGRKEIFLKRIQPGNVLGGDNFFSPSVWTVTLTALSEIQVDVLDYQVLKKIAEVSPALEDRLRQFCRRQARVPDLLKMSGGDRREYPRYPVILHTSNVLLDPFGQEGTRSFSGELFDISRQGLAFTARISSMDKARLLLGRHILTTIVVGDERLPHQNGVIVGVRLYEPIMRDYSVHVRLAKKIDETDFNKIVAFTGLIQ